MGVAVRPLGCDFGVRQPGIAADNGVPSNGAFVTASKGSSDGQSDLGANTIVSEQAQTMSELTSKATQRGSVLYLTLGLPGRHAGRLAVRLRHGGDRRRDRVPADTLRVDRGDEGLGRVAAPWSGACSA